ncbi:hypothetical protein U1Q18_010499 [Sarracenia purpurea var. burkii]
MDNVKTFEDVSHHLELEGERLAATKADGTTLVADSSTCKVNGPTYKCVSGASKNKNTRGPKHNSGATDHITTHRFRFMEYRKIPTGSKKIYMGNKSSLDEFGCATN